MKLKLSNARLKFSPESLDVVLQRTLSVSILFLYVDFPGVCRVYISGWIDVLIILIKTDIYLCEMKLDDNRKKQFN